MKKLFLAFNSLILIISCQTDDNNNFSECLQLEIERIVSTSPQDIRATIEVYAYQGEKVHLVNSNFPDDQSTVYNSNCERICTIGGIDGNENDTCDDWQEATFIEIIWTDDR